MHGTSSSTTWPTDQGAAPLFATARDPSRPNEGAAIGAVARSLGTPLLPWQQYVADVATERRPDGSYEYETIVVSVPRQTGKTTLIRAMGVHRAAVLGRPVFYTAQTGKDARARWMDLVGIVKKSPVWKARYSVTLRGGAECLTFLGNAGFHCFAPVDDCLHGYTPETVVLDEAFAHNAAKGELLMGAIEPAQQTIMAKQLWIVSTMGTADSTFLHDWIDRARDGVPRVALFFWGAGDDTDVYSPAGIETYHPGVGFRLNEKILTGQDVLSSREKVSKAEYERAFGNRRTLTTNNLIPVDAWRALAADPGPLELPTDPRDVTLSYDVSLDRLSAAIVATWSTGRGKVAAKVVRSGPGTSWLADAVEELDTTWHPAAVAAANNGPVLDVTAQLIDRGVHVITLDEREYVGASGALLARVDDQLLEHDSGDVLETSVTGLATRAGASDGVALSRRHSAGDSSAGIALAVGLWVTDRRVNDQKPVMYFAS